MTTSRLTAVMTGCLLMLGLTRLVHAGDLATTRYPRLGLYGSITGSGIPYIQQTNGALDSTAIAAAARYDEVILDVNPITPYRPDVIAALRQRHPGIVILAYVLGHDIWAAADVDSLHHYPTRYRRLVRDLGGFLYNKVDGSLYPGADVNLAKRDATGRFVVAEGLAALIDSATVKLGNWDGIFIDVFCESIVWTQTATAQIDYAAAGYPSLAAFDAAWHAGADTLANQLRRRVGSTALLVGNCAQSEHQAVLNGWMEENFPFQNGGTWSSNVTDPVHGYFANETRYRQPAHDYLYSGITGPQDSPYSAENARRVRYGLATATLGEGIGAFGSPDRNVRTAPYHLWWYDEYAVNLANGHSSSALANTHWLGEAKGPGGQMIWLDASTDVVRNPGLEAAGTLNWALAVTTPASAVFVRDTTTAAVGIASAHVSIATPGPSDATVTLTAAGSMPTVTGAEYAATFWARASTPRILTVSANIMSGTRVASTSVAVGTTWKRYQVPLIANTSAWCSLTFALGLDAGDVWLDDVHFQQGLTNVYRRDFRNGVVLVNPWSRPLDVAVGPGYQHILGVVDPFTNNGAPVSTCTVPAGDAVFLIATTAIDPAITADTPPTTARGAFAPPAPNPARGGAIHLRLSIASAGHVRCIVHDLQGRIVRTLLDGTLEAGEHAIAFDGRGEDGRRVRPGLYLVRCIGPGLDRTRTLVMLQ